VAKSIYLYLLFLTRTLADWLIYTRYLFFKDIVTISSENIILRYSKFEFENIEFNQLPVFV